MRAAFAPPLVVPAAVSLSLWALATLLDVPLPGSLGPRAFLSIGVVLYVFAVPLFVWLAYLGRLSALYPLIGAIAPLPAAYVMFAGFGALADEAEMQGRAPLLWFAPTMGALIGLVIYLMSLRRKYAA
jgi:hypothetical protein